ncbi:MAG: amino acid dehydrogenase [Bacteroidia bacterium]|nr:amino acid dehydrogenase [Bacteroidia bacterium]
MREQTTVSDPVTFPDLIRKYEEKRPEIVFEWKDAETEAEGWLVINSLRGGSAGGGTRMRKGLDKREVESLAKTMEIKFTVSGPPIGGAKSGINFDPADPRKEEVLERWFKAVMPLLKGYYGTGGDLNVDEIHEVIPITARFGLRHPQEGTVVAHFNASEKVKTEIIGQLQAGVKKRLDNPEFSPDITRNITVADMITGYGVAQSVFHYYRLRDQEVQGKKAIIQGWGNVGAAAGYYLSEMGAKICGIIDRHGGLIQNEGFKKSQVREFYVNRQGNQLNDPELIPFEKIKKDLWQVPAEIFIPAAASRLVHREHLEKLIEGGLELIACGANVPFADTEIFYGPTAAYADNTVSVIPDFISNCGMARVFRYLMNINTPITDDAIFNDVSQCIGGALKEIFVHHPENTRISQTALEMAIRKLI